MRDSQLGAMLLVIVLAVGLFFAVTQCRPARAEELPEDTIAAADEAGVDALDLQGAVNATELEPREYLYVVGELARPEPPVPTGWPLGGSVGQLIYCIEGYESGHGRGMYNPVPHMGEHAQGWLGYLPSTARRWGAIIGNRISEWYAAARMISAGAGGQFFGAGGYTGRYGTGPCFAR